MTCNCNLCQLSRRIDETKAGGSREDLVKLVDELAERIGNAEFELDVDEAILAGEWPSSEDYALRILEKIAKKGQS